MVTPCQPCTHTSEQGFFVATGAAATWNGSLPEARSAARRWASVAKTPAGATKHSSSRAEEEPE